MSERRVVITGVGAICALGNRAADVWEAARAGRSGARRVTRFDPAHIACKIACEVDFDAAAYFGREVKKLDLFTQYALAAADEAVARQPNDSDAHAYRGIILAIAGRPQGKTQKF